MPKVSTYKTVAKYHNFLMELYTQKQFNIYEMCHAHNIGSRLVTVLRKGGYIERHEDVYIWRAEMPTDGLAKILLIQCRNDYRQLKKKRSASQLTIKPIRKAPVSTPEPIVKEAEYDTSNSKMLLILAVGAMVGFMIATIIWK